MAEETGAVACSLKYRLPWPGLDSSISEDYIGLEGFLLEEIENRSNSTEGRLIVKDNQHTKPGHLHTVSYRIRA
jgi:hypothetical protein